MAQEVSGGPAMNLLVVTREELELGYLVWQGATCTRLPYQAARELPDGRFAVMGQISQEPTCELERRIVGMMREGQALPNQITP